MTCETGYFLHSAIVRVCRYFGLSSKAFVLTKSAKKPGEPG
ncbi:hypothetical protein [Polaromonas sp. CG9_12]|nr:hypothetical protein [Polaromonas sp. CG9_12]